MMSPGPPRRLTSVISEPAARLRKGRHSLSRRVLLGGLLVMGVIVGLLTMHTLNLHGAPAVEASTAMSIPAVHAEHDPHSAVVALQPGGTADDSSRTCADCGTGDHLGMVMACVLALLLVIVLLVPPRLLPGWMHRPSRPVLRTRTERHVFSRAPLIHVLCISRT